MKELIMLAFAVSILSSCNPIIKWQTEYPDNVLEEYIETLIQEKLGYDLDLTPITGEERQSLNLTGK
jgi:hypothetical protein